jgi:hypothetical protein
MPFLCLLNRYSGVDLDSLAQKALLERTKAKAIGAFKAAALSIFHLAEIDLASLKGKIHVLEAEKKHGISERAHLIMQLADARTAQLYATNQFNIRKIFESFEFKYRQISARKKITRKELWLEIFESNPITFDAFRLRSNAEYAKIDLVEMATMLYKKLSESVHSDYPTSKKLIVLEEIYLHVNLQFTSDVNLHAINVSLVPGES